MVVMVSVDEDELHIPKFQALLNPMVKLSLVPARPQDIKIANMQNKVSAGGAGIVHHSAHLGNIIGLSSQRTLSATSPARANLAMLDAQEHALLGVNL